VNFKNQLLVVNLQALVKKSLPLIFSIRAKSKNKSLRA